MVALLLDIVLFKLLSFFPYTVPYYLMKIKKNECLSKSELHELQQKKLRQVLLHAGQYVPFYANHIESKKLDNTKIFSFIKTLPIIDKKFLSENTKLFISSDSGKLIKFSSSGSSGIRTDCFLSQREVNLDRAIQMRWWQWAGVKFGQSILQTGMDKNRSVFKKVKDLILNTKYIYAFKIGVDDANDILNKQPAGSALCGYASSLYTLAELANSNNDLKNKFNVAISWGDKLFPHYKKKIKDVFGVDVVETYGCAEGIKMASQYDSEYMYVMTPNVFMEIVDDEGNNVPDGVVGHIILTSLDRLSMPMIRYRIGDIGYLLPEHEYPNNLKLNYKLLGKVIGRDTDVVILPDRSKLTVHSFTGIFEYVTEISQFRVIQKDITSIDIEVIRCHGISDSDFSASMLKINKCLKELISNELFCINFHEVNFIPNTTSGKPQIIKNEIRYFS